MEFTFKSYSIDNIPQTLKDPAQIVPCKLERDSAYTQNVYHNSYIIKIISFKIQLQISSETAPSENGVKTKMEAHIHDPVQNVCKHYIIYKHKLHACDLTTSEPHKDKLQLKFDQAGTTLTLFLKTINI